MIEDNAGNVRYDTAYNGYMFSVKKDSNGSFSMIGYEELGDNNETVPSIFEYLGIDLSSVYNSGGDQSAGNTEFPKLTADMLTVSDDLSMCTFSQSYMNDLADELFNAIVNHEIYKDFIKAQEAVNKLMNDVNSEINFYVFGERPCTHDCSSCSSACSGKK